MPKVSVILTSYNKPGLVGQAIESVFNQTFEDWELILCDDNSNSRTQEVLEKYLNHPKVIYLQSNIAEADRYKTCRYATLINEALKIARGKYISYLCDDDLYYPKRLELMARMLDEHPDYFVVYGAQRLRWLSGTFMPLVKIRPTHGVIWQAGGKVDHNSIMHRKSCLEKFGGWDDAAANWHSADAIFFNKLNQFWPFYPIVAVLDEHRFHLASVQSQKVTILFRIFLTRLKNYFKREKT